MAVDSSSLEHVSDTAVWVATFRGEESARRDAVFKDPLAARLAGERGQRIARKMAYRKLMAWIMVTRTVSIDRLIARGLAEGADLVVNLGAGLDTRPYRLDLPASLRWVEVDFPVMIDAKTAALRNETPRCRLERIAVDLSQDADRRALLARLGGEGRKIMVITEGVIPYLTQAQAGALADDLFATPTVWGWIQDYSHGLDRRRSPRSWERKMKATPFRFDAPDWFAFFAARGWHLVEQRLAWDEGEAIGRPFPMRLLWKILLALAPKEKRAEMLGMWGCVLLGRA
jgi:methyltransferase (TIGR00027 family)